MIDSKAERESGAEEARRAAWIIAALRPELVIATVWRPIESSFRMTDEVYHKRGAVISPSPATAFLTFREDLLALR
jgi:hypothetical protein